MGKTTICKAIRKDGTAVNIGDKLTSRGDTYTYVGCYGKPPPSTGRVVVRKPGTSFDQEFYPSVFDLEVVPA